MLNIHNLSISFQGEPLFESIAFRLGNGDRVGLIGKNGAGKSTLLKIISGDLESDSGQIATDKDLKIGFLKQDIDFVHGRTVLEESYEAFTEIKKLEAQLEDINKSLAERTDYESESYNQLMIDINDVQHQYEVLLLQNNDILLLDEPTNHLDIESIIWLESFLKQYAGAVVIVSHDKMFLDNVTNRTIEISLGRIYDYNKPYSKYLIQRKELREQQLASQKNQQKQIETTEKLIEKFRAKASKATMAQSLIKKLDKMDRIEVDEDDNAVMSVKFPISINPGKVVLETEGVAKNYGDNQVLSHVDLMVERGSKIAFVGQNGQGKSTLAKIIVGELEHDGKLVLGHNVQIGYFAQNQSDYLDGSKTVHDTMIDAANESNRTKVRDILGSFLFRGDEVDKYVRVLSGGERNRLALAKLLLQPLNVLVMDEPTNHLDIKSKNVLKEALKQFEGTLILVSHDRDFLQGITNKVYEFKDSAIKEYLGDIDFYLDQRNLLNLREAEKRTIIKETPKESNKASYEDQKKLKSLNNKLSKVESQINQLEKDIKDMDLELSVNYDETASKPGFFDTYQSKKKELEALMVSWEEVQELLEKFSL